MLPFLPIFSGSGPTLQKVAIHAVIRFIEIQWSDTGVFVSELCLVLTFGGRGRCGAMGGLDRLPWMPYRRPLDRRRINLIDTADVYSDGESEVLVGGASSRLATSSWRRRCARMGRANQVGLAPAHHSREASPNGPTPTTSTVSDPPFDPLTGIEDTLRALDDPSIRARSAISAARTSSRGS